MKTHQAAHEVTTMSRLLEVSPSGFYAWLKREPSAHQRRDTEVADLIAAIHQASRGTYGVPRMHAELVARGVAVSRKRVARLMRALGLQGVSRRRRVRTTVRATEAVAVPDLVDRSFVADGPNRLWVADITYVPTDRGTLYLAVVLDAWSRRIVGWAMRTTVS